MLRTLHKQSAFAERFLAHALAQHPNRGGSR
jgi:hypothetical protein